MQGIVSFQHESIVREIEEVLRMEIIAASTLPERPRYVFWQADYALHSLRIEI